MTDTTISPLRQRMIEDMTVRGFTPGAQRGYIVAVRNFTAFLGRSPDEADAEDSRLYQLHMRSCGASATSMNAAPGLKYRAALSLAYGAGLRASEVVSLKVSDIDSERIVIRVEQGKGRKDRYAMLPPLCSISRGLGGWRPVSAA